jgi:hypothetical protein
MSVAQDLRDRREALAPAPFCAFGVDVHYAVADELFSSPSSAGRVVSVEHRPARDVERAWHPRAAIRVLERRSRDGRLVMAVDHDRELGYQVYAPWNGRHLVSPNGRRITSALLPLSRWRWQRLFFAQVLPLAATLQGLELLHASAVEWHQTTLALVARAGTGKTSTAAHAVALGGVLLTDDVLGLEEIDGTIVGHSGVPTVSIDPAELARMSPQARGRLGTPLGRVDKIVLSTRVRPRRRRLDKLYFLERPVSGALEIRRIDADPKPLLANSFNTYVRTPERIVNQLAIVGRLADTVPVFAVRIPAGITAADVACAIVAHAEGG